jgi:SNF2 family DNA or RNA helicase
MEFQIGRKFIIVKTHATYQSNMLKTCGSPLWIQKGAFYLCPLQPNFIKNFIKVFNLNHPSLYKLLNTCIERDKYYTRILEECDFYKANEDLPTPIDNFPVFAKGMRHAQKVSLYASYTIPRFGLFLDMGIGKSKVIIDNIALRLAYRQIKTVLVVCPKLNIFNTWVPEFEKHSKLGGLKPLPVVGMKEDKTSIFLNEKRQFYIHTLTYDTLWRYIDVLPTYDLVVFDESRALGQEMSKRSRAAFQVSLNAKYVVMATGTPNTLKSMRDVFSQYKVMTLGQTFGLRYQDFLEDYFIDVGRHFPLWVLKKGSLEIIRKLMFTVAIVYKKEDCLDLPPRTISHKVVLPTPFQRHFMDCFDRGFSLINPDSKIKKFFEDNGLDYAKEVVAINEAIPISKVTKLQEITSGFYKSFTNEKKIISFHSTKLDAVFDIIDVIPNEKVIIWCRFSEDILSIQAALKKKKIKSYLMTGKTDEIVQWRKSKSGNILIAMEQVGKGMTLIETAYMVYYSYNYSLEHFLQSLDRNYRLGQIRGVYVFIIKQKHTVDQSVINVLDTNQKFSKKLTLKRFKSIVKGK